jgi:FecR protein
MKRFPAKNSTSRSITLWWISLLFAAATPLAAAASLPEAHVSQVIQDVRLMEAHTAPRPAVVNDKVTLQRAVRTGRESRAELTFTDLTVTRLGANTIFSLQAGAREVDLTSGTILLEVPSGRAPVKANTTSITVAIMGGTALLATGPPTKFMVLEGIGTFYPKGHPEKAVTVHGGEMVTMTAGKKVTQPEKFDVKLVLETSLLIIDFPPLANLPLILSVVNQQLAEQQLARATNQSLARNLVNVINVTDQNVNSNPVVLVSISPVSPTPPPPTPTPPPPTPPPSKFGTPNTITSPVPYLITSGTLISTDPAITTNGVTDFGRIYRGQTDDGAFTLWAFGSTSGFDTALGIDEVFFADPNHLPIATLKFQSLSFTGNPIIDITNGGVTKLALIGVDGITSGPPGGILTFTGLDLLALATVNGSINLTSDVSFQGLNELAMYARGAGSDLILNSPISNISILELAAEGSIQLTNPGTMSVGQFTATAGNNLTLQLGGSLLFDGKVNLNTLVLPGTTVTSGANVTLNMTGDYVNSSTTESSSLSVTNAGGNIGTGGNISVTTGGDFTANGDATFTIKNTTGSINNGGNIGLTVGGSIATPGVFSLLVENYDFSGNTPGHINTGGNISVATGGDLSAQSVIAFINNRSGGQIDSPVSLTLSIGGALTTSGEGTDPLGSSESLSVDISTRFDSTNNNPALASIVGGDATLTIDASSASIGGRLSTIISNSGSTLNGSALVSLGITHDVSIQGEADMEILNDADSGTPLGGMLHGSATLQLISSNFTANALFAQLDNRDGG